ncbi:MAG: galactokinase [bacterium]|nr:galactokinase [bacterium]
MKKKITRMIILSKTPFRLPLGGGSTDMPSYYEKYSGFIFSVTINMYMDIFIKEPITDDLVHMHYMRYEAEDSSDKIKHTLGKEALKMMNIKNKILVSFNADTPAGTGLGSSGACAVGLLKGLALYKGGTLSNIEAAERSFIITQNLGLPDGKQDPYVCALGGFVVLEIDKNGKVKVTKPAISKNTADRFINNSLFFYTGIKRDSEPILSAQNTSQVLELKHRTKEIGKEIYKCFLKGDLDKFGKLLDEHWRVKKMMSGSISNTWLDEIYLVAQKAGALGGKIMGAGGGGYFMFYCPSEKIKAKVRKTLQRFKLREMNFAIDEHGARADAVYL